MVDIFGENKINNCVQEENVNPKMAKFLNVFDDHVMTFVEDCSEFLYRTVDSLICFVLDRDEWVRYTDKSDDKW